MDLYAHLEMLAYRHLGESAWKQNTPLEVCNALLAKAFVEQWDRNGREAYFLVRAHAQLQLPSDYRPGNT
jgi:hypothetical protein